MKKNLVLLSWGLLFQTCASEEQNKENTLSSGKLQLGEIIHDSLSQEQMEKIQKVHSVFAEVNPASLEETITNFKRDQHPDNEIRIWVEMANGYESYLNSLETEPDIRIKKDVFQLMLLRSMVDEARALEQAELEILTESEAKKALGFYSLGPEPLQVIQK